MAPEEHRAVLLASSPMGEGRGEGGQGMDGFASDVFYRRDSVCAVYSTVVSAVATATEP
jgi:hypothetical protein